jgi:hypothetical protein
LLSRNAEGTAIEFVIFLFTIEREVTVSPFRRPKIKQIKAMKTILASAFFLLIGLTTYSQTDAMHEALSSSPDMSVKSQNVKLMKEQQPAFVAELIGEKKDVEDAWEDYVRDRFDIKFDKKKGVSSALGVTIPMVAPGFVTLYTSYEQEDTRTRLNTWVDLGGRFVDDRATEAGGMKTLLQEFVVDYYAELYEDVLDGQNKKLSSLTKEKEHMEKDGEKLEKEEERRTKNIADAKKESEEANEQITELKSKIESLANDVVKYEADIVQLKKDQENKKEEIEKHQVVVDAQRTRLEALRVQANKMIKQK